MAIGCRVYQQSVNSLTLIWWKCRLLSGKEISMIFQEPMSSLNPVFTVGFQLGEVLRQHMGMNASQARTFD